MEKIIILDTNFLVANTGKINEIIPKLEKNNYHVYVPKMVQEEYINIQLRKIKELYKKIENIKSSNDFLNLKYENEEKVLEWNENGYNKSFKEYFGDNVIGYKKANILENVLARNRYKEPPFYDEPNSSDKGFKDTIILLTITDFINSFAEEARFYFVTSDNGFIKYKSDIENELFEKCIKNVTIVEGKDKNKLYKELSIIEEDESKEGSTKNIFSKNDMNLEETRKRINELMDIFIWTTSIDFYGNPQDERRFEISNYINNEKTEKFLNNIDDIIENNIFRNEILVETFFGTEEWVFSKYSIDIDTMKEISQLYKNIKDTKYKEAFINYISQRINENKVSNMFTDETDDDDLPF